MFLVLFCQMKGKTQGLRNVVSERTSQVRDEHVSVHVQYV